MAVRINSAGGLESFNPASFTSTANIRKPSGSSGTGGIEQNASAALLDDGIERTPEGDIFKVQKGGNTFFVPPSERKQVAQIEARRAERGLLPSVDLAAERQAKEEMKRKLNIAKVVGAIDFNLASQLEEQGLNVKEYLAAGTQQAAKSAAGYGAAGAAAGLLGGPAAPVSVPGAAGIGAVAGAIKGFYDGVTTNMKAQRQDLVSVKTKELSQRKTAIKNYISAANANPAAAEEYVFAMNTELSLIRRDYNTLVKRGNEDLEFWGSDATPQLVEYEIFFESIEPSFLLRMEQAVLKPDPTRAYITAEGSEE